MEDENPVFTPSHLVTLAPIPHTSANPRRLSSRFAKPSSPIKASSTRNKPAMAWVSLQGRLIGAEEATSARAIGGGLNRREAVAWELFSPIHRVLIVAVVAVAKTKCEKNRQILQLKNCIELRDQILMSMQQKLDNLCEEMNCIKDQSQAMAAPCASKIVDFSSAESSFLCNSDSICTDCWLCDQHRAQLNDLSGNSNVKTASTDEMFRSRLSISNETEQEERRMSDLSDWAASSITSAADMQLNNLAIEQDTYNLKKECEEKDAAIKELSAFIRSKDNATSKRIEDLEEIIRRKNTIITRLKKDMIVLEQKVVSLTRMRRRSYSGAEIEKKKKLPAMTDNLLYDMDSTTSPSSSDSDSSSKKQHISSVKPEEMNSLSFSSENENVTKIHRQSAPPNIPSSSNKPSLQIPRSRPATPLQEKSLNQRHSSVPSPRITRVSSNVGPRNSRRRTLNVSQETTPSKRWM